jgi:hypothetical protein
MAQIGRQDRQGILGGFSSIPDAVQRIDGKRMSIMPISA